VRLLAEIFNVVSLSCIGTVRRFLERGRDCRATHACAADATLKNPSPENEKARFA